MKLFKKTKLTFSFTCRGMNGKAIFDKDFQDELDASAKDEVHPRFNSRWPTGGESINHSNYTWTRHSKPCSKKKDFQLTYDELATQLTELEEKSNVTSISITAHGVKNDMQVDMAFRSLEGFRQFLENNKLLKVDNAKRMTFTL